MALSFERVWFWKFICYNKEEPERQSLGVPRGKSGQHRTQ